MPSSERAIFFFGAGVESQQARIAELEAERDRLLEVVTDLARYAPDEREESSVAAPQFGLTAAEFEVFEAITAAWGKCVALKRCHPTEVAEAIPAIHYSQGAIMQRAAVRLYLTYFTHVEGFE